jgi:fermentation-respiration switch protein FrsA (DUF1100 family)
MLIIKTYLNQMQALSKHMSGLKTATYANLHGKQYKHRTKSTQPIDTQVKACFRNAALASITYGYHYVEGYYTTDLMPELVLEHAWNIDDRGRVIDYTAEQFNINVVEYFGVAVNTDKLWQIIESDMYTKRNMTPLQILTHQNRKLC